MQVLRSVLVIGRTSHDGRLLLHDDAMYQAMRLCEGRRVFRRADHNSKAVVGPLGRIWNLSGSRAGLLGDLHLAHDHPATPQVLELSLGSDDCPIGISAIFEGE